ncbi:CoA transferase [Altererythrobacter sp. FM1]|uniref:CaiB/BaiF CoA transferase family protein n=1 Tax=Tsuneonella flava TaxID=2055955 RepID=UPI000C7FB91F|nr:CaiB/BaiF CoA-transferase family protein [Tsuneonella flava]ROT97334.1 CoA transferase [Altererythrobacter sp. FM1]
MQPLAGITVVSLEQAVAAPFATRQLADLGARVIKVERPEGDFARGYDERVRGLASYFVWCNRSKESIVLDLKTPEGAEALMRLVARADVLVQNLAPGSAARMGFDYATLKSAHPRLIVCDISGYGSGGPDEARKAYDLLIQSEAGFLSVTGDGPNPAKAGISVGDIAAGMYAYSTILAALIERDQTGHGQRLDISMLESLTEWMSFPLYYAFDGAPAPRRVGAEHATIYPYGPFPASDGEVMLGIQNDREWTVFCAEVLENAPLARDPRFDAVSRRSENRTALREIIAAAFAALTVVEVTAKLDAADIANAAVNDMARLWRHDQLAARNRWRHVETPVGPVPSLLPPGLDEARMDPVPAIGEHTERILKELGL